MIKRNGETVIHTQIRYLDEIIATYDVEEPAAEVVE